jgi:hypothetical protein
MASANGDTAFKGDGIIIFEDVPQALQAERVIKKAVYAVRLIAPPPEFRMGCDLALEVNLVESAVIERLLKEGDAAYTGIYPLMKDTAELCEIVKISDLGRWTMVKAANMKMTFDKNSGVIVNISGGGCPDIPYLNIELVDKPLTQATRPKELGFTLCTVMLDRAFEECLNLWQGGNDR